MIRRELVASLEKNIEINGKLFPCLVTVSVEPELDADPFDMDFESEEEKREFAAKLNSGEVEHVMLIVRASLCGEEGTDYLGSCFIDAKYTAEMCAADNDMIDSACAALKESLLQQHKTLSALFNAAS